MATPQLYASRRDLTGLWQWSGTGGHGNNDTTLYCIFFDEHGLADPRRVQ
jgi:hypothetical protein